MPKPLTPLERRILDYLVDYVRRNTYQPSIREIGAEFGIKSTKTVSEHLQALADKGWVERDSSRSRGVRLLSLDLDADVVSVPHIDVHLSDASLDEPLDSLTLDRRLAPTAGAFLVSMIGDTMRHAGIRDGDLLLVEPVPAADLMDGDLVLARADGETLVRRFTVAEQGWLLEAPGGAAPPVRDTGGDMLEILGHVTAVVRRLRTDAPVGRARPEQAERVHADEPASPPADEAADRALGEGAAAG